MDYLQLHLMIYSTILFLECLCGEQHHFRVFNTAVCPRNQSELNKRSAAINCNNTNGYMCFPNEHLTQLQEFCYNLPRIGISKNLCIVLNNKSRIDYHECHTFSEGCPDKFYFSNTAYKYPNCAMVKDGCFLAEPSCTKQLLKPPNSIPTKQVDNYAWIWIVTTLGAICISCIPVCLWFIYHRSKATAENGSLLTEEITGTGPSLLNGDDIELLPQEHDLLLEHTLPGEADGEKPSCVHNFYIACQEGMTSLIEDLIKDCQNCRVSKNSLNTDGTSPLYIACQEGHNETVQVLLENGADVHLGENSEYIPFYVACQEGHDEIVKLMLAKGANINSGKTDGASPLFIACQQGHASIVQLLLNNGAAVNLSREGSFTPLYIACQHGFEKIVQLLLSAGADVNIYPNTKMSPLFKACGGGFEKIAKMLLERGADVNFCENSGGSPLFIACQNGHDICVQLLLSKGANVNLCKRDEAGPLFVACQNRHKSTVQILLQNGANANALTDTKLNSLVASCAKGVDDIVKILLEGGADANAPGALFGYSPLWFACNNNYYSIVEMLLRHDADINQRAEDGSTPLSTAIDSGNAKIVNLLKRNGAKM
uniref:Ankyrin-2-like isoform X2 n=1 Tax=Crassostrea virginica TaxID=6565 RepID=A0A8B8BM97_CRAVI|nr:ankyrin-2-like isoform X2 [Crassostrea virginica]